MRRETPIKYNFVRAVGSGATAGNGDAAAATGFSAIRIQGAGPGIDAPRIAADALVPFELLQAGKFDEALAGYRKIKREKPDNPAVSEARLNNVGYAFMRGKRMAEAIVIFKLNTELYPDSWNTYDSLGEAYMNNGDKALAIESYKKSLALNPQNANGATILKKLETEKP